jgi:hypothetical protein
MLALSLLRSASKNAKVSCKKEVCGFPQECFEGKIRLCWKRGCCVLKEDGNVMTVFTWGNAESSLICVQSQRLSGVIRVDG